MAVLARCGATHPGGGRRPFSSPTALETPHAEDLLNWKQHGKRQKMESKQNGIKIWSRNS